MSAPQPWPERAHVPVLAAECVSYLNVKRGGVYVDGTVGSAGHSLLILEKLGGDGAALIGIDCDKEAAEASADRLKSRNGELGAGVRCEVVWSNYRHIDKVCKDLGIEGVDGILLDLGISSDQISDGRRGFAYAGDDSPLDMRMDGRLQASAADIVNGYSERELADIMYRYGEERWAARISKVIVERRARKPVSTTGELTSAVLAAIPKGARREGSHPAKRVYQSLRIAVNDELGGLAEALQKSEALLKPGGRLCVVSFHSLEDRIVKRAMRDMSAGCICPKDLPACACGHKASFRQVTGKPVLPSEEEIAGNPRAASAKLRVAEKL